MFEEVDYFEPWHRRLEGGWNESYIDDAEIWKVAVAGFLILTLSSLAAGAGIGGGASLAARRATQAAAAPFARALSLSLVDSRGSEFARLAPLSPRPQACSCRFSPSSSRET